MQDLIRAQQQLYRISQQVKEDEQALQARKLDHRAVQLREALEQLAHRWGGGSGVTARVYRALGASWTIGGGQPREIIEISNYPAD
eukprot:7924051-Pyramimonas_sp.AAC.1